eukprot:scaffold301851_cov21-Tisochrysis_lutea.AAC.1
MPASMACSSITCARVLPSAMASELAWSKPRIHLMELQEIGASLGTKCREEKLMKDRGWGNEQFLNPCTLTSMSAVSFP